MREDRARLLIDQIAQVQVDQPDLELVAEGDGELVVRGTVRFCIVHDGQAYRDAYQIDIAIPDDFPDSMPAAKETAGAVPAGFHRFTESGNLCLAAPVELIRVFAQDRSLACFIDRLLIPYLFSYTYYREHGDLPHGELSHGLLGLLEYYQEFFGVGAVTTMKLLKLLADAWAPLLMGCPCDSGRTLRDCHGPKLLEIQPLLPPSHFERDLREMIAVAQATDIRLPEREVMPRRMWKNREKRYRKALKRRGRGTRR